MPLPSPPDEYVEINGVPLYWWIEVDWTPLFDGAEFKGEDIDLSHAEGSLVVPRRRKSTNYKCKGFVYCDHDRDGNELTDNDDMRAQMRDHKRFLVENVCSQPYPADPLVPLVLHGTPDLIGDVIVGRRFGIGDSDGSHLLRVVFDITIPNPGELVEA